MATTPQKDAIVFILDVNPSLWETKSTENAGIKTLGIFLNNFLYLYLIWLLAVTLLDKGIHAITQMIHQKVSFSAIYFHLQFVLKIIDARKTDQLALVIFNTDGTDNKLASQSSGEYAHVTIAQEFESPSLGTIKYLRDKLALGREAKADSIKYEFFSLTFDNFL